MDMVEDLRLQAPIKSYPYPHIPQTHKNIHLCNKTVKQSAWKMKQKMVIRVFMDSQQVSLTRKLFNMEGKKMGDKKMRAKILKTIVTVPGVDKAEFKGSDKCLVEVEGGDGFNPIDLIEKLRRSACRAEIETVAPVKEEAKKEPPQAAKNPTEGTPMVVLPMQWPPYSYMTVY